MRPLMLAGSQGILGGEGEAVEGDEIFFESYYPALCAKLECGMRFGKRRKDKDSKEA